MEKNKKIKIIVEIAIFAALGFILDYFQGAYSKLFPWWGNGGSIGIAMVPVFVISYRRGLGAGLITGLIIGLMDILDGFSVSPMADTASLAFIQVLLDYIIGWVGVGLAGIFSKKVKNAVSSKERSIFACLGVIIGGLVRLLAVFLSGYLLWPNGDNGSEVLDWGKFVYSLGYNASYLLPCIVLCAGVMVLLLFKQPKLILDIEEK